MKPRSRPWLTAGVVTLALAIAVVTVVEWQHRARATLAVEGELRRAVELLAPDAARLLALPVAEADAEIRRWAAASGLRITLIARDGGVFADSWTLPTLLDRLENHSGRPEIVAAAGGRVSVTRRRSSTTDHEMVYVAREAALAGGPAGFLRVAREMPRGSLPWGGLLAALAAAAAATWLAHRWAERRHAAAARHLLAWTELPPAAELAALAEEADRRFRELREELVRELHATRSALSEIAEGVVMLDGQGVVRFANPAAVALLGTDLADGRTLVEAVRAPELIAAVTEVLKAGHAAHTSVSLGGGIELAARVCPVAQPPLAAAVVLHDTREERQLERSRRALVADLAHELRTPLTVLGGVAEEARETGRDEELVGTLERQVTRLRMFAEELEELVALESGQVRLHNETVEVGTVVRQTLQDLAGEAATAGVELTCVGSATLSTDPVRLAQVVSNLVENGIRYNRPGGRVNVRIESAADVAVIHVEDDGIGIPAAEIPLVFQRFYRVRRGASPKGGSGLGLAIVKHLMRALGGGVQLSSQEGAGTTVTLRFPCRPARAAGGGR